MAFISWYLLFELSLVVALVKDYQLVWKAHWQDEGNDDAPQMSESGFSGTLFKKIMLGLAVLFFLGLWIVITRYAMRKLGAFLGFMLTMGVFIVYWVGEFAYIQYEVSKLCRAKGGIEEYVSVDEFKERLATNNWEGVPTYTVLPKGDVENEEYILFQGKEFEGLSPDASIPEIGLYLHRIINEYPYSTYIERLNIFNQEKVVLVKYTEVRTGTGAIANDLSGLKLWINALKDCSFDNDTTDGRYFSYKKELNNAQ